VGVVEIEGRRLVLSNLDKVLWPEHGMTKGQMLDYYARIAPTLLPHLRGRPVTLRRFPDGVGGISWHQNECKGEPDWFHVHETGGRGGRRLRFCVVDDLASLMWVANQAAVEIHPFLWSVEASRRPLEAVFDLDPGAPAAGLADCARIALRLRELLADLSLESFPKTSGSLGLHVHVPLGTPHAAADTKAFARVLARVLATERPDEVVAEMRKADRAGKVYVDWLQNDATRQTVAPYSLRGLPVPTVATPVTWDEVDRAAAEDDPGVLTFLPDDVLERVERLGDLFAPVRGLRQRLPKPANV
jgi:bifunctional non-homologous end joining protein LigD